MNGKEFVELVSWSAGIVIGIMAGWYKGRASLLQQQLAQEFDFINKLIEMRRFDETGLFVPAKRGEKWEPVLFEDLTDIEFDEFIEGRSAEQGWAWARALAQRYAGRSLSKRK